MGAGRDPSTMLPLHNGAGTGSGRGRAHHQPPGPPGSSGAYDPKGPKPRRPGAFGLWGKRAGGGAAGWLRLAAVGLPLGFNCVLLWRLNALQTRYELLAPEGGGALAGGGAPGRGFNGREGLEPGGGGGAGGGEEEEARAWPLFAAGVERQPDFGTFERLYASDTQSWRIEKFGRVCVVADAFLGLAPASSHGTALTVLAEALAAHGFDVTLLYTGEVEAGAADLWQQYYTQRYLTLVPLPPSKVGYDVPEDVGTSHRVYEWLRAQGEAAFDAVHFADHKGVAHFAAVAKHQGLALRSTELVVHLHAPHMWFKLQALQTVDALEDLVRDHLETQSAALADFVVTPSHYMASWAARSGWGLDAAKTAVLGNPLPAWIRRHLRDPAPEAAAVDELVYYGRLELRKGLVNFCDALDRLAKQADELPGFSVTFLGRIDHSSAEFSLPGHLKARAEDYIASRARKWGRGFRWQILKDMDAQARLEYMAKGKRLAVMPAIMENSPYTVRECVLAGVPFVASRVGGVAELLAPADAARLLVQPYAKPLALRLAQALREGVAPAGRGPDSATERDFAAGDKAWVVWHHLLRQKAEAARAQPALQPYAELPPVTVTVTTYNNPGLLRQAIDSVRRQTYAGDLQLVVVDDGSTMPEAVAYGEQLAREFAAMPGDRGWRYVVQPNRGPGAARNNGAVLARGEYLLFMDDDNVAKEDEVARFVAVAQRTGADVLTCTSDYFFGDDPPSPATKPTGRWVPIGAARTVGMFQNMYGDTNSMFRAASFRAVGGFPEDFGYAMEDWELFSKHVVAGFKLETIPDPLFWYRLRDTSHSRTTARYSNNMRTIRPYLQAIPQPLHQLVLFAQGMKDSHDNSRHDVQSEQRGAQELKKMLRALTASLHTSCQAGRLLSQSRNLVLNGRYSDRPGGAGARDGWPAPHWKPHKGGYALDDAGGRISVAATDSFALKAANEEYQQASGGSQVVTLEQTVPSAVIVSGWSKADKVSGHKDGGYALYVDIAYKDGTKLWGYAIPFDVGTHGWQFKAGVIDPEVPIKSLEVYALLRYHSGTAWFDDIGVSLLSDGLCDFAKIALEGMK